MVRVIHRDIVNELKKVFEFAQNNDYVRFAKIGIEDSKIVSVNFSNDCERQMKMIDCDVYKLARELQNGTIIMGFDKGIFVSYSFNQSYKSETLYNFLGYNK